MVERYRSKGYVGYKQPPTHARFQKGRSGNPGGRPRSEPLAAATIVAEELQATVFVMENGQRLKASKFRLLIKQTINQAIKGNVRALKIFLEILDKLERLNKTPTKMHPRVRIDLSKLSLEEKTKDDERDSSKYETSRSVLGAGFQLLGAGLIIRAVERVLDSVTISASCRLTASADIRSRS
jgi:hypothetical protein